MMHKRITILAMFLVILVMGCEDPRKITVGDRGPISHPQTPVLGIEVRAAMDQERIALNFQWESSKTFAGQFRNLIAFDGEKWAQVPDPENFEEDRLSIMFEDPQKPVKGFDSVGCYISCHMDMNEMPLNTKDSRHYVLADGDEDVNAFGLDMWHWRGARSGPMGYAEDTYVSRGKFQTEYAGRKRDSLGTPPTNWVRAKGDRLREDQPLEGGVWKGAPLPRFVFNPPKVVFKNYFLADETGKLITTRDALTAIESLDYIPMKVIYQDYDFDSEDKVNAIDVHYLLYLAGDMERPDYTPGWEAFWTDQLGITTPDQATALLDDIVKKMEPGARITRTVGFIYDSSQHDITSTREFDYRNNIWTVTLLRDLKTGNDDDLMDDVDLSGLLKETVYNMAFSVHDISAARLWHHISLPYKLGNQASAAEIKVIPVTDVSGVNWDEIDPFKTAVYMPGAVGLQHLTSPGKHRAGASFLFQLRCQNCHTLDDIQSVANKSRQYIVLP